MKLEMFLCKEKRENPSRFICQKWKEMNKETSESTFFSPTLHIMVFRWILHKHQGVFKETVHLIMKILPYLLTLMFQTYMMLLLFFFFLWNTRESLCSSYHIVDIMSGKLQNGPQKTLKSSINGAKWLMRDISKLLKLSDGFEWGTG